MNQKTVFLDRDGIINEVLLSVVSRTPFSPLRMKQVVLVEGIKEVVEELHSMGYLVIVVTNQPDVARHIVDKRTVDRINKKLKDLVGFDDIFTCYHDEIDKCDCRKPKAGLFLKAKGLYGIDFSKSYVVGDRWRDIEAGKGIGAKTIFVDYNYGENKPKNPSFIIKDIKEIVGVIKNEN